MNNFDRITTGLCFLAAIVSLLLFKDWTWFASCGFVVLCTFLHRIADAVNRFPAD